MKILLINNNPVVSRLTALSARKEEIEIDEIQEVTELKSDTYDIVFVDADSWNKDVESTISTDIKSQKRVLFYAQDDHENLDEFDKGILKPFLPSEVSAVIRSVAELKTLNDSSNESEKENSVEFFDVLKDETLETKDKILEKIDTLEEKEDEILEKVDLDILEKESTVEKVIAPTLLTSDKLDLELAEVKNDVAQTDLINELAKVDEGKVDESSEELFELDLDDNKVSLDDELFTAEPKAVEKELDDGLLEFDLEKENEVDFDLEKDNKKIDFDLDLEKENEKKNEVEAKVLDTEEIETIKEILDDDENKKSNHLDDLVVPAMAGVAAVALASNEVDTKESDKKDSNQEESSKTTDKRTNKKEEVNIVEEDNSLDVVKLSEPIVTKKSNNETKIVAEGIVEEEDSSDTLVDALATLKVESLKELLAGATVTLNIQFPKA